ncbi:Asp-tRNA(Asn)/Glu-tRNA(Gln) amidotransferase subunit GatC [Flavobacteriales bacterium]|nr:Asp-tRNA(Asn)/Glu-tRNA(Gln) amidotransferase subunit GatC [Flavobacteriales bacterium]MDB4051990.1 Asp-tRNA(Asn)/Glu-tRNA(Gln) amidotransferase subunit GatC [Flavobacteriales bacterium]MDC0015033.1 Asp-tRNA(Asn)/Glu-tRNA(Gln) amidotransferase subunit GatC [Flavobacteriales bacterium]
MEITNETIDKLAVLAKLQFKEGDKESIRKDLSKIIAFVDKIDELDTEGVEPLIHINREVNVLREDEVSEIITQVQALKNAPSKDSDYFKIATVLKK